MEIVLFYGHGFPPRAHR